MGMAELGKTRMRKDDNRSSQVLRDGKPKEQPNTPVDPSAHPSILPFICRHTPIRPIKIIHKNRVDATQDDETEMKDERDQITSKRKKEKERKGKKGKRLLRCPKKVRHVHVECTTAAYFFFPSYLAFFPSFLLARSHPPLCILHRPLSRGNNHRRRHHQFL